MNIPGYCSCPLISCACSQQWHGSCGSHWRRICHCALTSYGISEACAAAADDRAPRRRCASVAVPRQPAWKVRHWYACSTNCARPAWSAAVGDPLDRRAKALSLTAEGRRLAEAIEAELVRVRRMCCKASTRLTWKAALRVLRAFEAAGLGGAGGVA
uniref:Uncharacterized protein n=1 Tax=Ditylenchus dipsaci TaxID=166011 RepID=A0A915DRL3_9BILA